MNWRSLANCKHSFSLPPTLTKSPKKEFNKGRIVTEILKQSDLAPIPFEKQVLVLYAALNGYFNKFQPEQIQQIESKFLEYIAKLHKDLLDSLREQKQLTEDIEGKMKLAITKFIESV